MFNEDCLQQLVDEQNGDDLRKFLEQNPDFDLNNIVFPGVSILWWALNPPEGKDISEEVIRLLLETQRIDPTQEWYGQRLGHCCPSNVIQNLLSEYEDNYVQEEDRGEEDRLAALAADGQNTHDPLVVKQYDRYIEALYKRYIPKSLAWQKSFDDFVQDEGYDQKPYFKEAIARIKGMKTSRPLVANGELVNLTNADLAMLLWSVLNDENNAHFVADETFSDEDRKACKQQLLNAILDAQHEYALNSPACFMGTRHHLIRTLDKVHIDCLDNYKALTEAHISELYDETCATAITDLGQLDKQWYDLYFQSLFNNKDVPSLEEWAQTIKEAFWDSIETLQQQTLPVARLPQEEFSRLKDIYQDVDTPLSFHNHPLFAFANRIALSAFFLKNGASDLTFTPPSINELSSEEKAQGWLLANYNQNTTQIMAYLRSPEGFDEPLYALFFQRLNKEACEKISQTVWRAILQGLVSSREPALMIKKLILQNVEEHFKNELGDLSLWVNALPLALNEAYFTQWLKEPSQNLQRLSFSFASQHNQWQHFSLTEPLVFTNEDLRGIDLSTLDLSWVSFHNCDLRLTKILQNPTLKPEHLQSSQIEENGLWIAAQNGYVPVIANYLLLHADDLEHLKDNRNNTLLHVAARHGQVDTVKTILAVNSLPHFLNAENSHAYTALKMAAWAGHIAVIDAILTANNSLSVINAQNGYMGTTVLMDAVLQRKSAVVEALLDINHSLDVMNVRDWDGKTALMLAAEAGYSEIVKILLAANSSLDVINAAKDGKTALMLADEAGHSETIKTLLAANSSLDVMNARDSLDSTALILAVKKGHIQTVETILAANSSIDVMNAKDLFGETALIVAAEHFHTVMVCTILAANSSSEIINASNKEGKTAPMILAKYGLHKMVAAILEFNSSLDVINASDREGKTVLIHAVEGGKTDVVEAILAYDSSLEVINVSDQQGNTPLIIATQKGDTDIAKAILEANSSLKVINVKDKKGNTPLLFTSRNGFFTEELKAKVHALSQKQTSTLVATS